MGDEYDLAEEAYWAGQGRRHRDYGAPLPRERPLMLPEIQIQRGGIQFPMAERIAKELEMQNDQDLLTQAEELRDQAAKLERIVAEREKYGEDPFKNGTVLKVSMRYRTGSRRSFDYAVVKIAGRFYLSGKLIHTNDSSGMDWAAFVAWLSQGDASVWQAKSLTQVF